jgi:predicted nucleic acid-binding protein
VIILDTNVVSELMKAQPDRSVMRWFARQPALAIFMTSISRAEILYGIELLPAGRRRDALQKAANAAIDESFAGRILSFTSDAAPSYAAIAASRRAVGQPIMILDAQIAAITRKYGGTLATRNVADFEGCGIDIVNPWDA